MISVVICSINNLLAGQVKKNISDTIGIPHEVIIIDNTVLKKGLAHVYNLGASQAKYDIICFVHEDVLFQTPDWGNILAGYFQRDEQLGIVGVAGSKYKSRTLSGWWIGIPGMDCCNILNFDDNKNTIRIYTNPDPEVKLQPVVTLDGVFLCARKAAWQATPFNEALIRGFHFYDIDFSFSIATNYKAAVTFEIDIMHLNRAGDFGTAWVQHAVAWHRHHQLLLPRTVVPNVSYDTARERHIYRNWLYRLRYERITFGNRLRFIFFSKHWMHFRSWAYIAVFLFYRTFNKSAPQK